MMFAIALSALALAGSVPVIGGTAGQRAVVRQALASSDPGAVTSARIDARDYLVLGTPLDREGARQLLAEVRARASGAGLGHPVRRSYDSCHEGTALRWERFLGV